MREASRPRVGKGSIRATFTRRSEPERIWPSILSGENSLQLTLVRHLVASQRQAVWQRHILAVLYEPHGGGDQERQPRNCVTKASILGRQLLVQFCAANNRVNSERDSDAS